MRTNSSGLERTSKPWSEASAPMKSFRSGLPRTGQRRERVDSQRRTRSRAPFEENSRLPTFSELWRRERCLTSSTPCSRCTTMARFRSGTSCSFRGFWRKGVCVCGEDLDCRRFVIAKHVMAVIAQSDGKEEKANYLAQVLHSATALHRYQDASEWEARCSENESLLGELDEEVRNLDQDERDMDAKLRKVDDEEVQVARGEIEMLEGSLRKVDRDLSSGNQDSLERSRKELNELDGVIRVSTSGVRGRRVISNAYHETSAVLVRILDSAYASIRDEQIRELGDEMNRLFARTAQNVVDDDALEGDRPKATLRMIERVGLKSLEGESRKFEIFALNSRGRSMPPTEINGASRRILALSFVLSLCKVSRTHAPLVADSLLNFMSGSVRTNTLRVTAETASQPILLLTGSDLESENEVELVSQYGGATYTLTGQWQTGV